MLRGVGCMQTLRTIPLRGGHIDNINEYTFYCRARSTLGQRREDGEPEVAALTSILK